MRSANHMSVQEHLVRHHGYTLTSAMELMLRRTAIVQNGMRWGSPVGDVAGKVLAVEAHACNDKCKPEEGEAEEGAVE